MGMEQYKARVGSELRGKWKLERLIGVGGMAAVYVARHRIGRMAAIKVLHTEVAVDKQVRERFEQEALAVNSIGHDGVVEVIDIDSTDDGSHFLVMELLDGETLADRAERDGKVKVEFLLKVVDQLLDVLVACHRKGIIHRDIKPENLYLLSNGRVKVLDFGIARMREGVQTVAGTMLGTVAFMPAEQLKGGDVDARSDLFAVGATMFAVLTGRRIFDVDNDTELAMKMLTTPAPPLESIAPELPQNLCMVVDRALAYLPERRYPDAQTMRGDVWSVARNQRPPYAHACKEAGMSSNAVTLDDDKPRSSKTRPDRAIPTTAPQLPAFAEGANSAGEVPSTDPQMPAFLEDARREAAAIPNTLPEMPAYKEPDEAGDADEADEPSGEAHDEPGEEERAAESGASADDGDDQADADEEEEGDGEEEEGEESEEKEGDGEEGDGEESEEEEGDGEESEEEEGDGEEGEQEAPSKPMPVRTDPRWPAVPDMREGAKAKDGGEDDDDEEEGASTSDAPSDSVPPSEPPLSEPPTGDAPDQDAREVARQQARGGGSWLWIALLVALAIGAAWWAGLFAGGKSTKSKVVPSATATRSAPTQTAAPPAPPPPTTASATVTSSATGSLP